MGDRRFDAAYKAVAEAPDRVAAIRDLDDEEVVHALAAASRKMDAYLANVLAVEVLNRRRRQRAVLWGAVVALGAAVLLRTVLLLFSGQTRMILLSFLALVPAAVAGYATHWNLLRGPR